jgi:glucuronate isomerase
MSGSHTARELEVALADLPMLDAHSHLVGGALAARGLHDLVLYHMAVSELYASGCPSGARLTEFPGWPTQAEAHARLDEAMPFLPLTRNTGISWLLRDLLADLYDWREPLDAHNWRTLDAVVRERADDRIWQREVLERSGIRRTVTEFARRGDGSDDDRLQYALEWAMFARVQVGEWDSPLYELERTWGRQPESPAAMGAGREPIERPVTSVEDVEAAVAHYVSAIPRDLVLASAMGLSTDIDYRVPSDTELKQALTRRTTAGPDERDVYAGYVLEAFLSRLETSAPQIVFQFSIGAEPLPFETGSRLRQRTLGHIADMASRHPGLRFQVFNAARWADAALCSMIRELPNLSIAGYWWHSFFPAAIEEQMRHRLDMLPVNRQVGFFSDAYCVEWAYAKAKLARRLLARVLAERVDEGRFTVDEAVSVAADVLYVTPQHLLGMVPANPPD